MGHERLEKSQNELKKASEAKDKAESESRNIRRDMDEAKTMVHKASDYQLRSHNDLDKYKEEIIRLNKELEITKDNLIRVSAEKERINSVMEKREKQISRIEGDLKQLQQERDQLVKQ